MDHPLLQAYGLTTNELLDLIDARFRLKVALEGGVAEFQMEKHVARLVGTLIDRYESIDLDGVPDFKIWLRGQSKAVAAECKNVRNKGYLLKGELSNYAAEIQKTRAAKGDPTSRYYDVSHFQIVGVCLGKHTGDWSQFMFIRSEDLARHRDLPHKIAVMHRVPVPGSGDYGPWSDNLADIIKNL